MPLVPVIDCITGRTRRHVDRDVASTMKGVRLVRDRKQRVIRVLEGEESPMVQELVARGKPSNWGRLFVQGIRIGKGDFDKQLPTWVFALRGVRGSERTKVLGRHLSAELSATCARGGDPTIAAPINASEGRE